MKTTCGMTVVLAMGLMTGGEAVGTPAATRATTRPATQPVERAAERCRADLVGLELALDLFELDCGRYPTTEEGLGALLKAPEGVEAWHGPYTWKLPKDPWGNPYDYVCPGQHNPRGYDVLSRGPDGQLGTDDDLGNWQK